MHTKRILTWREQVSLLWLAGYAIEMICRSKTLSDLHKEQARAIFAMNNSAFALEKELRRG